MMAKEPTKTTKKRLNRELLIDREVLNLENVVSLLAGGKILSFQQMLEGFGVEPRSISEEFERMKEVTTRAKNGEKVTFDRSTSIRLRLIEILDEAARIGPLSRAWNREGEKKVTCYFLKAERENLVASGAIRTEEEKPLLDTSLDLKERVEMLKGIRGRSTERIA